MIFPLRITLLSPSKDRLATHVQQLAQPTTRVEQIRGLRALARAGRYWQGMSSPIPSARKL